MKNITGNLNWLKRAAYRRFIPALAIALFALSFLSSAPVEAG